MAKTAIQESVDWIVQNAPDSVKEFLDEAYDLLVDIAQTDTPTAEKSAEFQATAKKLIAFTPEA